jgi:hypothetical protein
LWITIAAKEDWSAHLNSFAFVLCRCEWYCPTKHSQMLGFGNIMFLDGLMDVSSLELLWNWASSRINRIVSKIVTWTLRCSSWLVCLDL